MTAEHAIKAIVTLTLELIILADRSVFETRFCLAISLYH